MMFKKLIRKPIIHQSLLYFRYFFYRYFIKLHFKDYKLKSGFKIYPVDNNWISFFGYYNLSPKNFNGDILFQRVNSESVRGSLKGSAKILMKNSKGKINQVARAKAWNWQQGCMLQWFPLSNNFILFNDYDKNQDRYVSKVFHKRGNLIRTYPLPVNNVSKCGKFALCLNYDRLSKMRPDYGYFNRKKIALPPDKEDGIFYLNLKNGKFKLIISYEKLKSLSFVNSMVEAIHKVNHIEINPSGKRFMFLHRWVGPNGRFMRLITANNDGSDIWILNGDKMTSHSCWFDDKEIISFCSIEGKGTGYFRFFDKTRNNNLISKKLPKNDGHPSVSPNQKYLITDSYPDKSRMARVYLYEFNSDLFLTLGRFYQPIRYKNEIRIDLHPKWSVDGKSIFIESGHRGGRSLYEIDISRHLFKQKVKP